MLILELYYHLAFNVTGGPSKEFIEFENMKELEMLLKNFPTLSIKNDRLVKSSDHGDLIVGRLLQNSRCEFS